MFAKNKKKGPTKKRKKGSGVFKVAVNGVIVLPRPSGEGEGEGP